MFVNFLAVMREMISVFAEFDEETFVPLYSYRVALRLLFSQMRGFCLLSHGLFRPLR